MDPQPRGPDWMQITPKAGSLFHAYSHMTMSQEIPTPAIVAPQVLLGNHLKALKLPTFAREYEKVAMESTRDRADYLRYVAAQAQDNPGMLVLSQFADDQQSTPPKWKLKNGEQRPSPETRPPWTEIGEP